MEDFWEKVSDAFFLIFNSLVVLFFVQIVLHFGRWGIDIPWMDRLVNFLLGFLGL